MKKIISKSIDRIKSYPKTVAAVFFAIFLFTQFYSIYFRYSDMPGPMSNGVAYYIALASYFKDHGYFGKAKIHEDADLYQQLPKKRLAVFHFYSFHGLSPMYIAGKLAYLSDLTAETAVKLLFCIGMCLAGIAIFLISKREGRFPLNPAMALLIFAFYSGNICYRGFIDPSPQFFSTVLWMLSIWVFLYSKRWYLYFPPLIFLLLFSHVSGVYGIVVIAAVLGLLGTIETGMGLKDKIKEEKGKVNIAWGIKSAYKIRSPFFVKLILLAVFSLSLYVTYKKINCHHFPAFLEQHMFFGLNNTTAIKERVKDSLGEAYDNIIDSIERHPVASAVNKSSKAKGLVFLLNYTDFKLYFMGYFLPLTLAGIYMCIRKKNYRYLALLFVTFFGCVSSAFFQDTLGYRTFQHLEISILLLYAFVLSECIIFLWEYLRAPDFTGKGFFKLKPFSAITMLVLGSIFLMYLSYIQVSNDFCCRFYAKRSWDIKAINAYLDSADNKQRPIFYLGPSIFSRSLLSLDGFWDKQFYVSEMLRVAPDKKNSEFLKNFIFIAGNNKFYKNSNEKFSFKRYGIAVAVPFNKYIALNTGWLPSGEYQLSFCDSGINDEDIDNIEVYAEINSEKFKISKTKWEKIPLEVKTPWRLPSITMPQHLLADLYITTRKPDYWIIRKTFTYSMNFELPEGATRILIKSRREDIPLAGEIDLKKEQTSKFKIDLDHDSAKVINSSMVSLDDNGRSAPISWVLPKTYDRLTNTFGVFNDMHFLLVENFGDLKAFELYLPLAGDENK